MLKGKTRFELTDVNTGERKVFEKHNMVTNAASNILNGLNAHLYHPLETTSRLWNVLNNSLPMYQKIFGGLLLFDKVLTESVNTVFPDGDAHIVGTGSTAYSGNSVWRGSLNGNESGLIYDGVNPIGYRFVWDFGTDKANGTIQAVALTSANAGSGACMGIETATASEAGASMQSMFTGPLYTLLDSMYTGTNYTQRTLRLDGDYFYYISTDGLTLYKRRVFPVSGISVLDEYNKFDKERTTLKTLSHSYQNANVMPDGNLAVTFAETNRFVTYVLSVQDWSEETVITPFEGAETYTNTAFYYDGEKVYLVNANGVKILDADTGDLLYNSTTYNLSSPASYYVFCVGDYLFFCTTTNTGIYGDSGYYQKALAISRIDMRVSYVNMAASHRNSSSSASYWYYRQISCDDIQAPYILLDRRYDSYSGTDYNSMYAALMPQYLLTIQNLGSPGVTKTNAQTMKVTYEITEDLEPENI